MLYGNIDLIDTNNIQPGDDVGAENGSTTPPPGPPPPVDIPDIDWTINPDGSIDVEATFSAGEDGFITAGFEFNSTGIDSIDFGWNDGIDSYSTTFDFDAGSLSQSFTHDFGGGMSGTIEFTAGDDGFSTSASVDFFF